MTTLLEELKLHLNITDDEDNAILTQKLDVATAWVGSIVGGEVTDADPAPIHEAARMLAAHLYENREATLVGITVQELPLGAMALLDPYRAWAF